MKRTERHHLKEDGMVRGLSLAAEFLKTYQREFLMAAGALAVAALVFAALTLVRSYNHSVFNKVVGEVHELAADLGAKPENLAGLEKLAEKGRYARMANLELAKHWYGQGDLDKAESFLARIPAGRKDLLHYQAEDLRAQVLLRQKEYDQAIAIYAKIRDEKPKAYPLDAVLFRLAEATELKGENKEALDLFKKIQEEYAQTYYGYEASLKASRLALAR
jgi:tetratricopeptide (TPR) repeat protein